MEINRFMYTRPLLRRSCLTLSLKWKPPNENSIDFKLKLRFDESPENPQLPDLTSKPLFLLEVYRGGRGSDGYLFMDRMVVSDDEWEK